MIRVGVWDVQSAGENGVLLYLSECVETFV